MLWTIILILLILWALGGFLALGPLIHILLVIALVLIGVGALLAYRTLWGEGGVVERKVARHRRASSPGGGPPTARP